MNDQFQSSGVIMRTAEGTQMENDPTEEGLANFCRWPEAHQPPACWCGLLVYSLRSKEWFPHLEMVSFFAGYVSTYVIVLIVPLGPARSTTVTIWPFTKLTGP